MRASEAAMEQMDEIRQITTTITFNGGHLSALKAAIEYAVQQGFNQRRSIVESYKKIVSAERRVMKQLKRG